MIVAGNGENGQKKNSYGKAAQDIYVKVPVGTLVIDQKVSVLSPI